MFNTFIRRLGLPNLSMGIIRWWAATLTIFPLGQPLGRVVNSPSITWPLVTLRTPWRAATKAVPAVTPVLAMTLAVLVLAIAVPTFATSAAPPGKADSIAAFPWLKRPLTPLTIGFRALDASRPIAPKIGSPRLAKTKAVLLGIFYLPSTKNVRPRRAMIRRRTPGVSQ